MTWGQLAIGGKGQNGGFFLTHTADKWQASFPTLTPLGLANPCPARQVTGPALLNAEGGERKGQVSHLLQMTRGEGYLSLVHAIAWEKSAATFLSTAASISRVIYSAAQAQFKACFPEC